VREEPGLPTRAGRIVEVEAYGGPDDRASHARAGRTPRTALMFGPAGLAYVYLVYGMHNCLNVVSGLAGDAGAVLIRAVEPLEGLDAMYEARVADASSRSRGKPGRADPSDALARGPADAVLASGPGRLCAAFGVNRAFNGTDLCAGTSPLRLERARPGARPPVPAWTTRVGVDHAGEPWSSLPWRLIDRASGSLSGSASRNAPSG